MSNSVAVEELVPRPASLLVGLIVGAAIATAAWFVIDPNGPLSTARLASRLGIPNSWGWRQFLPYGIAVAGVIGMVVTAVRDHLRFREWDSTPTLDVAATLVEKAAASDWRSRAYQWCKARLPERYGHEHLKEEIRYCRGVLIELVARRWGKYFALAFALTLAAFLAGYAGLKTPVKTPPNSPMYEVFWPLLWVSGGAALALLLVLFASMNAHAVVANWTYLKEQEAVNEFRVPVGTIQQQVEDTNDREFSDREHDEENDDVDKPQENPEFIDPNAVDVDVV